MFDYAVNRSDGRSRATRWTTAAVSAVGHAAVLVVIAIAALYATDTLPEPRTMMAYVTTAPAPPPPPPPPPPATEPVVKHTPKKVARTARPQRPTPVDRVAAPAPVTAPVGISAETGLEGGVSGTLQAGFEGGIPGGVIGGILGGIDPVAPPPPPRPPTAPVRVGGVITAPRLIQRVDPEYPPLAERAQIEGVVILEAVVNPRGRVETVRVLRSHRFLQDAAIDAVQQWAYEPLMLNGEPVPFVLTVTLSFSMPERGQGTGR